MADTVVLTHDALDVNSVSEAVGSSEAGAISVFVGTTRCSFEKKRVVSLEYEAYVPMAKREMAKLCVGARAKWPDLIGVAVYHRLGSVPVREASVMIAVSSPHRIDAIAEACHFVIDELKASVPIWKRECYEDGSVWKENSEFSVAKPQDSEPENNV